ncbi:MAG: protein kinase [Polyangiaceae bacterium]|nr:protein kinase [Polyangiaceae bacterium]
MNDAPARPYRRRWLDRYYLCEPIASGGMATVHAALTVGSAGFHRLVAIKLMHPHLIEQDGFLAMFEDEARVSARLHHPFLAPVLDHGVHEGEAFLAMDYLDGLTFHTLLRRLRQSPRFPALERWRWALRLIADACEGLHAAHEACGDDGEALDIVHRDISPSNLFVCRDGTVRVLDFGVVKSLGRQQLTETGAFKGKLAYMAPEYLRTGKLDRRADIFALGLVLQELLCLRRAYGTSDEGLLLQRVLNGEILPLREQVKGLPVELERLVQKALHPAPEGRFQTARALSLAIETVLFELGEPFSIGQSAGTFSLFFPEEDSRVRALLQVLPEARSSRADSSGVMRVASSSRQPLPLLQEPSSALLEVASVPGTLRSGGRPAPSSRGLGWLLVALFLGGGLGGGALVASRGAVIPAASVPSPLVSAEPTPVQPEEPTSSRSVQVVPVTPPAPVVPVRSGPAAQASGPGRLASSQVGQSAPPSVEGVRVRVTVSTPGGSAQVYWRGVLQGSTPCTLAMEPGRHTLELEPPGAPRRPVTVVVNPGEPVYMSVPFERLAPADSP